MKQKILYSIIVVLLGVLVWQQMYRGEEDRVRNVQPTSGDQTELTTASTLNEVQTNESDVGTDREEVVSEVVTVTGTYVGLRDEVGGDFADTSVYLLLDDGTEIISIDLRPLIGTQKTGVEAELGINRGDRLELTGVTENGAFEARSITVVGE